MRDFPSASLFGLGAGAFDEFDGLGVTAGIGPFGRSDSEDFLATFEVGCLEDFFWFAVGLSWVFYAVIPRPSNVTW